MTYRRSPVWLWYQSCRWYTKVISDVFPVVLIISILLLITERILMSHTDAFARISLTSPIDSQGFWMAAWYVMFWVMTQSIVLCGVIIACHERLNGNFPNRQAIFKASLHQAPRIYLAILLMDILTELPDVCLSLFSLWVMPLDPHVINFIAQCFGIMMLSYVVLICPFIFQSKSLSASMQLAGQLIDGNRFYVFISLGLPLMLLVVPVLYAGQTVEIGLGLGVIEHCGFYMIILPFMGVLHALNYV